MVELIEIQDLLLMRQVEFSHKSFVFPLDSEFKPIWFSSLQFFSSILNGHRL